MKIKGSKFLVCRVCREEKVEVAEKSVSVICSICTSKLVNGEIFNDGKVRD